MTKSPWQIGDRVGTATVVQIDEGEPYEMGGIKYGGTTVWAEFPRFKRKSKGWRRHMRAVKAQTLPREEIGS